MKHGLGEKGVTMVEMGVTLAIIGILAAVAGPTFVGIMPKVRLNNNAATLSNEVAMARVRAIAKSTRFRIVFNPAADTYTLQREDGGSWLTFGTTRVEGSDLVSVTNVIDANTLIADWNGTMSVSFANPAMITLQIPDGSIRKRVVVEGLGRVYVERSFDGGSTWQAE